MHSQEAPSKPRETRPNPGSGNHPSTHRGKTEWCVYFSRTLCRWLTQTLWLVVMLTAGPLSGALFLSLSTTRQWSDRAQASRQLSQAPTVSGTEGAYDKAARYPRHKICSTEPGNKEHCSLRPATTSGMSRRSQTTRSNSS